MKQLAIAKLAMVVAVVLATDLFEASHVHAQSGTRTQPVRSFESRFWDYLRNARYTNWAPRPGQNGDFYEGSSPHGAFLKMYLNRTAIANPNGLPSGSVIVKENYGKDKKTVMAITVMYRLKDYNPAGGDWYWVKYLPDGTVATAPREKGGVRLAGKVNGCIQCHSDADGNDFTFVND